MSENRFERRRVRRSTHQPAPFCVASLIRSLQLRKPRAGKTLRKAGSLWSKEPRRQEEVPRSLRVIVSQLCPIFQSKGYFSMSISMYIIFKGLLLSPIPLVHPIQASCNRGDVVPLWTSATQSEPLQRLLAHCLAFEFSCGEGEGGHQGKGWARPPVLCPAL